MHTLFDVESGARRHDEARGLAGWPQGYPAKARLVVPQAGKLVLPRDTTGLDAWRDWGTPRDVRVAAVGESDGPAEETSDAGHLELAHVDPSRAALLTRPAFVAQLPTPNKEWFEARRIDTSTWRRESPRHLLLAARVDHQGRTTYGAARTLFVENGLGFGSTSIAHHEEVWLEGYDSFADHLALQVVDAVDLQAVPEGNGAPWTTAMLLLNDRARELALPTGWQHALALVAGLYRVRLKVHASAWANRTSILFDIKTEPPEALLVADGSISAPETFLSPYRTARPQGYAHTLGSRGSSFEEQILELGEHLKVLSPRESTDTAPPATWTEAQEVIEGLECPSFVLTERARASLTDNPYPDAGRMTWHLQQLAALAGEYAKSNGAIGQRVSVEARRYGIEIAMQDGNLSPNRVSSGGESYLAEPHVKVDDYKTPDKCGRIYFAIDPVSCVFIVDHIGLHDY